MSAELPLIAKDAQALIEGLVASHGDQLRRILLARARNTVDVQDITQERHGWTGAIEDEYADL